MDKTKGKQQPIAITIRSKSSRLKPECSSDWTRIPPGPEEGELQELLLDSSSGSTCTVATYVAI